MAAVNSVLAQDFSDYEIIVVDDGSQPRLNLEDLLLQEGAREKIRIVDLAYQPRGRGPGYARNVGVWASSGTYCTFLDDDDIWLQPTHLSSAHAAIEASDSPVDLHFSNQEAFFSDSGETKRLWLYGLAETLSNNVQPSRAGCYSVDADQLIAHGGFSHLNTTIVSRELFNKVSGIDEYIGYEEDLDFYLRAIDQAGNMLLNPDIVARHHVPDASKQKNVSTSVNYLQRLNIRLYLLNKNMVLARHPSIAAHCLEYAVSTTKHMAENYVEAGNYLLAYRFALRALGMDISMKWLVYCLYLRCRSWLGGGQNSGS
jgi:glycosyltransferase involved in cell wall biosynthesis